MWVLCLNSCILISLDVQWRDECRYVTLTLWGLIGKGRQMAKHLFIGKQVCFEKQVPLTINIKSCVVSCSKMRSQNKANFNFAHQDDQVWHKNYFEKIYNIDVANVNTRIQLGKCSIIGFNNRKWIAKHLLLCSLQLLVLKIVGIYFVLLCFHR